MPHHLDTLALIEKHLADKGAFNVMTGLDTEGNLLVSGAFPVKIDTPHVAFDTYGLAKAIADRYGGLKNRFPTCHTDNLHIYNAMDAEIHIQPVAFPTCVEVICFVMIFHHKD